MPKKGSWTGLRELRNWNKFLHCFLNHLHHSEELFSTSSPSGIAGPPSTNNVFFELWHIALSLRRVGGSSPNQCPMTVPFRQAIAGRNIAVVPTYLHACFHCAWVVRQIDRTAKVVHPAFMGYRFRFTNYLIRRWLCQIEETSRVKITCPLK